MAILAIDPGPEQSACVLYDDGEIVAFDKVENTAMFTKLFEAQNIPGPMQVMVIEQVAAMGMSVGAEVFETVFWSGRFAQAWREVGGQWHRLKRHEVKTHLCGNQRAKDANIRQALIDRFGPGKDKAIGRKASPGPLYGITKDCWSALALAVTFADTRASDGV